MYKLCIYTRVKMYGGDEEGGWHYDSLELVSCQEVANKDYALVWLKHLQSEFKNNKYYVAGITKRTVKRQLQNWSRHNDETYYSELGLIATQTRGQQAFH